MKTKLILLFLLLPLCASAQVKFGYLSYAKVCQEMPQYEQAKKQLADLQAKYEQEANRSEAEFQRKFADFLQGQKDFPSNILQKRQAELQEVMERGIAFRKEAQDLLSRAEKDLMNDVYKHLNAAIEAVGNDHDYAFILNTDDNAAPFINPQMGEDVTDLVRLKLGIIKELPRTAPTVEVVPVTEVAPVPELPAEEEPASEPQL